MSELETIVGVLVCGVVCGANVVAGRTLSEPWVSCLEKLGGVLGVTLVPCLTVYDLDMSQCNHLFNGCITTGNFNRHDLC